MTPILKAAVRSVQPSFAWPARPHHVQYRRFIRAHVGTGGLDEVSDEEEVEEWVEEVGESCPGPETGVFLRIAMISLRL